MRILFNGLPQSTDPGAGVNPGSPIRQPGKWAGVLLASLAGVIVLSVSFALLVAVKQLVPKGASHPRGEIPWVGMILVFFLCILAHEFLHMLLYPDAGRSDATILFIDWSKLQFGAYYEGSILRARWIAMRLLPMVALTILSLAGLFLLDRWMTFTLESYLWVLILTNSLGSGADLAAVIIVLQQVPAAGVLNFHRGRAYWLPG
jgi:hypothetical protein